VYESVDAFSWGAEGRDVTGISPDFDFSADFFFPNVQRPVTQVWSGPNFLPVGLDEYSSTAFAPQFAPTGVPEISPTVTWSEEGVLLAEDPADETVVPEEMVFEPHNEWYRDTKPTDWERVYDEYVVLNPPLEEEEVAIDWGTLIGGVANQYVATRYAPPSGLAAQPVDVSGFGNTVNMPVQAAAPGRVVMPSGSCSTCPTGAPRYAKICTATGEITPLRRRRRRRLLTAGDLSDIASLKAIVGGGAALNAAVVKAMK